MAATRKDPGKRAENAVAIISARLDAADRAQSEPGGCRAEWDKRTSKKEKKR